MIILWGSVGISAGAAQTEMARILPDTRPLALLTAVQNRSRRFCVRRVEELFAFADRIEQAALSRVNNLSQSILAKAFRSELTADWRAADPELIRGEHSAEALLTRIKAERARNKTRKKA